MRETTKQINQNPAAASTPNEPALARVLIVADDSLCPEALVNAISETHTCQRITQRSQAAAALASSSFDLVLVSETLPDGCGLELISTLHKTTPATKAVVLSAQHSANTAVQAMQCGAVDFMAMPIKSSDFKRRINAATARARADRMREDRLARLKKVCKQLNIARHEISEQIDLLCHDLVCAYQQMSSQVHDATMASEFRTLIRQELDVEDLLRTALEYALTKTGPTNAAVFLPDGPTRFSLGAYVNYDCPRETIDMVLEQLGECVCPQMVDEDQIIAFDDAKEFASWVGIDSGMLGESRVVAFSCHHEEECLAVIVLFRSKNAPFEDDLNSVIDTLRPIFAEQLSQVIKVHHRAQPHWPNDAHSNSDDELDYNDDAGYGYGDLAA